MAVVRPARLEAEDVDAPSGSGHSGRGRSLAIVGVRLLVVLVCLGLWQLMSGHQIPMFAVSKPTDVLKSLGDLLTSSAGWVDIRTTAMEILLGFVIGVVFGTVAGLVFGTFRFAGQVVQPLIAALNGIPKIALGPLFLLFFGIGSTFIVAIAVSGVAFVMFYNLYYGLRTVPVALENIVRVMGGRRRDVLRYVTLPSLAAPFFAGLQTSSPLAIIGVIVGEFIASNDGIGHLLFNDANDLDAAGVFSGLVVLVVISLLVSGLLGRLDKAVQRRLGVESQ